MSREGNDKIPTTNCREGVSIGSANRFGLNSLKIDKLQFVRKKVAASAAINNKVGRRRYSKGAMVMSRGDNKGGGGPFNDGNWGKVCGAYRVLTSLRQRNSHSPFLALSWWPPVSFYTSPEHCVPFLPLSQNTP